MLSKHAGKASDEKTPKAVKGTIALREKEESVFMLKSDGPSVTSRSILGEVVQRSTRKHLGAVHPRSTKQRAVTGNHSGNLKVRALSTGPRFEENTPEWTVKNKRD